MSSDPIDLEKTKFIASHAKRNFRKSADMNLIHVGGR